VVRVTRVCVPSVFILVSNERHIPAPSKNLSKCSLTSQQAGGPPNPVAKPLVPSVASISTQKEPRTLIPHDVRDFRYFSYCDMGVDILLSAIISIGLRTGSLDDTYQPMSSFYVMVVSSRPDSLSDECLDILYAGKLRNGFCRRHNGYV